MAGELLSYRMSHSRHSHELAVCKRLARPGSTAVDVGAYVGTFAVALSRSVGRTGTVFAFEPQRELYEQLRNATWATRVIPMNVALSSHSGPAVFSVPVDESSGLAPAQGSLEPQRFSAQTVQNEVRTLRLDDLLGPAEEVSMMKIDVEGHEWSVLEGAKGVIATHRPALVVEIEQRHIGSRTVADVVRDICELGAYRCEYILDRQLLPWSNFDVDRDQLQWIDDNGRTRATFDVGAYVNNFVFTRK
ncbi:FkbM family methyltransferase [uncultured Jatrophihabitans sp.]|uniref:FkbM family methyltransferase n=1 Tax=uncultured Jatrophihabitans sp. TaxID=1610747 RepID=UPI0035C9C6EE